VRYCFVLRVRPDLLGEYTERHAAVWPDMLRALRQAGWERYSLFARPDGLIVGYVEAEDLDAATEIAARIPAARMGGSIEIRPVIPPDPAQ